LLSRVDLTPLPPISADGINDLPWEVITETSLDSKFRASFPKYLRELDGKVVRLLGFMQPLRDDQDMASFLFVEYPVGCWYCEMPASTGLVYVELPGGRTAPFSRNMITITGRLRLNANDPEDFLYTLQESRVSSVN
jgi:hypothetical protein